ncbi:suppressor of cytokine signaling 3b [Vanacampus margaritifer]
MGKERRECVSVVSPSPSLDASSSSAPGPWTRCVTPPSSPLSPSPTGAFPPPVLCPEADGRGAMVASRRREPLAMSGGTPSEGRVPQSDYTPHHFKPFSSHAHYQQVMRALAKLQESGFYWGAVGGREASSLLRSEPPGTFLIRDSSDNRHFFTLSVQTARGTKNLRVHSECSGFFLQPDAQCAQEPPRFDCVLKLIAHYMGKGPAGRAAEAGSGRTVYLIHTGGERIPLELRRPLLNSLSSLQHMCRRTLNNQGLGGAERLPHTLKDFLEEYDAPI